LILLKQTESKGTIATNLWNRETSSFGMSEKRTLYNIVWSGWWFILYSRIVKMKEKETKNEYEYKHLRICEKWLQIESCRKCLFELLCHYEKNFKNNQ